MKKSQYNQTSFPALFASGETASVNQIDSESSGFTYMAGIPSMYASLHGKKVVRADVNGLGRMITQSRFFNQCGGYYTFDRNVCDAIGGYAEGAILNYKDVASGIIRKVRSNISDNTYDFVTDPSLIDGVHWSYVDEVVPNGFRPRIFPDFSRKTSGTLKIGDVFVADKDMLFVIQSGPSTDNATIEGETCCFIYVNVKRANEETFHAAGMLAAIPPVSSAYDMTGISSQYIWAKLEQKNVYTAFYSSSPVSIYMNVGDSVNITENVDYAYSSEYVAYPLTA